jgi:5-methylcytosine-specific restriction endonuclease McrA
MRIRRKGTTDYRPVAKYKIDHSGGYIMLREKDHPLTDNRGYVYEHRFVFFNKHGNGPFKCHWCGIDVDWDTMDVDHLDDNKTNNNINNLVASCPQCNTKRGRWKMVKKQRENGKQITYNGVTKTAGLWAKDLGLSRSSFMRRMECWDIEDVMKKPHGKSGPKRRG